MTKTDIWMPLVIGDYLKDTQHLDATQHGCYLLWLMHYWTKGPLPASIDDLVWLGRLRCEDAPSIAQALLDEFFKLEPDGLYHQKRADIEKLKWNEKHQAARGKAVRAAKVRWNGHISGDAPSNASSNARAVLQGMPQAMLEQCPSPSPIPLTVTTSPLERYEEQKPKQDSPSPAAGFSSPNNLDEAQMIASAVIAGIGVTTKWARVEIVAQAKLELEKGIPMDDIRYAMITRYEQYRECARKGLLVKGGVSPEKFFGDGLWKRTDDWGFKKGADRSGIVI